MSIPSFVNGLPENENMLSPQYNQFDTLRSRKLQVILSSIFAHYFYHIHIDFLHMLLGLENKFVLIIFVDTLLSITRSRGCRSRETQMCARV